LTDSIVDRTKTIDLLKNLVKINSVNPSLVDGAPGEVEIAELLSDYMQSIGLRTQIDEVKPGRPNVVGVLEGEGEGPSLLLNGHTDTVGIDYMDIDPFDPVVEDGNLYGRGAFDMKGGLAAIIAAAKAVADSGEQLKGSLVVAAVCDEEYASIGTEKLMEHIKVDAAIVGEPTELNILIAHKGFSWVQITTKGVAAHGSQHETGVDAIAMMGRVLRELEILQERLTTKTHGLVGYPTLHASIIEGGRELSTYPDTCTLKIERRTIPGEDEQTVEDEMESIIQQLAESDSRFQAECETIFSRGSMEVSADEPICRLLERSVQNVVGKQPSFIGRPYWLDTEIIANKGVPVVSFGPSGYGGHAATEYVELESVISAARVLESAVLEYLGAN
jgi:acetylornithine deacetylase